MGIQPVPELANIWLSCFEQKIRNNSRLFKRYMDDILTIEMYNEIDDHLTQINSLHPNLKFTVEVENEKGELPFLDTN